MRILFILTYYRPHVSGLTIYVERLARALAERGHQVTVLTSHYAHDLAFEENLNGVRVVRIPVLFRFSKGVLMPTFVFQAWREIRSHEVVNIHLPQVEAALATGMARLAGHRPVITYHCDLKMPPVWFGPLVDRATYWISRLACQIASAVVTNTADFARYSPLLSRFMHKVQVIPPPITIAEPDRSGIQAIKAQVGLTDNMKAIGFAARFAHEKGADYLINAIPYITAEIPNVRLLFVGPRDAVGETTWRDLQDLIQQYTPYLRFLGTLPESQMPNFFAACDVVTVPSINSTESFSMVQVEAFLCGTPVVVSDLPGVRQPVLTTGMGEVVAVADAKALAEGIVKVLQNREKYIKPRSEIQRVYGISQTVEKYETLFARLRTVKGDGK